MKSAVIALAIAASLAACSGDQAIRAEAEQQILNQLKDPESARFTDVAVVRKPMGAQDELVSVCGQVNARNPLGGYPGPTRFVVGRIHAAGRLGGILVTEIEGQSKGDFEREYWSAHCA
jgi:hypothetical protein